jgi:hypothetical protein
MEANGTSLVAHTKAVSAVFKAGMPVYLRRRIAGMDKIVLVNCAAASGATLVMQWSDTETNGMPPRDGEEVTCQSLRQGVLFVAKGRVEDVSPGKQPRLRIRVGENCIAVPLRKWPRYQVCGRLRLSQTADPRVYSQNSYHSMNISLGGFGVELAKDAWDGGEQVDFALDLLIERNGVADVDLPGITIAGTGVIRRRHEVPERNTVYVGLQFQNLAQEYGGALEFWLAAHSCYMRAV